MYILYVYMTRVGGVGEGWWALEGWGPHRTPPHPHFIFYPRIGVDLSVHEPHLVNSQAPYGKLGPLWQNVHDPLWQTGALRPFFIWPNPKAIKATCS